MPVSCPGGKKARYRIRKTKKGHQRLAFCGNKVVEVTNMKKNRHGKLKKASRGKKLGR